MRQGYIEGAGGKPVLMSLDGIYKNGRHIGPALSVDIPNETIIRIIREHNDVIFGASVHPYRIAREMMDYTSQCIDAGAAFFHWIPSAQQIDPDDDRCIPFYLCLAREGIPLLFHRCSDPDQISGIAFNRFNAPSKMKKALEAGVKVVAAHALPLHDNTILAEDRQFFNELLEMLMVSDVRGWDLYADISAFCQRTRAFYIEKLRKELHDGTIRIGRITEGWGCFIPQLLHMLEYHRNSDGLLNSLKDIRSSQRLCGELLLEYGIEKQYFAAMHQILRQRKPDDSLGRPGVFHEHA